VLSGSGFMSELITDVHAVRHLPKRNGVPLVLFCYWSGGNMSEARKLSLDYLLTYVGLPVVLVDKNSFLSLSTAENPIHPAFEHLSAVHQSDYVRTYLWHYWGGAWHDIKASKVNLTSAWDEFADPDVFFVGKPEVRDGPARVFDKAGRWMPDYWQELVSVIAWVGRPRTLFSETMLSEFHAYLDTELPVLIRFPGRNPRERKIQRRTVLGNLTHKLYHLLLGREVGYPIPWTLFGNIFHPINLVFKKHVSKNLPRDTIKNAGIYHRRK
jgi:hypothetical protein